MSYYHLGLYAINSRPRRYKQFKVSALVGSRQNRISTRRNNIKMMWRRNDSKYLGYYKFWFCKSNLKKIQIYFWHNFRVQFRSIFLLTFFVRFVIFWHAQNLKNIPFKIVALEIKWIRYFSMNLWKKLFITNNFLYLLIEKIYGWTTIPNNTGW